MQQIDSHSVSQNLPRNALVCLWLPLKHFLALKHEKIDDVNVIQYSMFTNDKANFRHMWKKKSRSHKISLDPKIYLPETGTSSEKSEYAGDGIDSELKSLHLKYVPAVM